MSHSDRDWLLPCAIIVAIEIVLWFIAWRAGIAYAPMLSAYSLIALAFFGLVTGAKIIQMLVLAWRRDESRPLAIIATAAWKSRGRILSAIVGLELLSLGSSAFSALKGGIPHASPFWLDLPLARLEAPIWPAAYRFLGWSVPFFDRLYGTFVLSHLLAVFGVLVSAPSAKKSRALVTLCLTWVLLGVCAAYLLSSAGPLFYDRVFHSQQFTTLDSMIAARAPLTGMTADALWRSYSAGIATVANGISAMPSMHVGLTLWLALVLKDTKAAPLAWIYYGLIWTGSVLLGWHYLSDGALGSAGVLALWQVAPKLLYKPSLRRSIGTARV